MGVFFTNYQMRTQDAALCAEAVTSVVGSRALVSDAQAGWVSVYDETSESQNENELERVAKELSSKLAIEVFAFLLHDSDVFMYWLYRKGKLVDRFNSRPDYFGPSKASERKKWSSDFNKLVPLAAAGTTAKKFQRLVAKKRVFEEELAREFAGLMGINPDRACTGFKDLSEATHGFTLVYAKGHSEADTKLANSVESGDVEAVKAALGKGASPNGMNQFGESLLVIALRRGWIEIAALLLGAGADPFINPKADALWAAATFGHPEILRMLLQKPSEQLKSSLPAALMSAVMAGQAESTEELLNAGADPNVSNVLGTTPLLMACSRGTEAIAEVLSGRRSEKPADWKSIVSALLKAGAQVNVKDQSGMTPLLLARAGGQKEIAEMLLNAGADPNAKPGEQFIKMVEMMKAAGLGAKPKGTDPGQIDPKLRDFLLKQITKQYKK